jgi:hypothetical protein
MNIGKILLTVSVVLSIAVAFVAIPYQMVALLALGLVYGFMNPIADMQERTAFLLIAFAAPTVADRLDLIPAVGTYLNSMISHLAVAIAGIWIANFVLDVYGRIKP